jgi:hypothetical protein
MCSTYGDGMIYLFAMPTAGNFTGGADRNNITLSLNK